MDRRNEDMQASVGVLMARLADWKARAERAEAELATLRARLEAGPVVSVGLCCGHIEIAAEGESEALDALVGQRVRLVPEGE